MNIHEHQAKDLLKKFGAPVPFGVVVYNTNEILTKIKSLKTDNLVVTYDYSRKMAVRCL